MAYVLIDEIVASMTRSVEAGASVQSTVRTMHSQGASVDEVAEGITAFRRRIEVEWLREQSDQAAARKRINNVINDVSRLARDLWGKSIVCSSRKEHTYVAVEPSERAEKPRSTPTPTEGTTPAEDAAAKAEIRALKNRVEALEAALEQAERDLKAKTAEVDEQTVIIESQRASLDDLVAENEELRDAPEKHPKLLLKAIAAAHGKDELARMTVEVVKGA